MGAVAGTAPFLRGSPTSDNRVTATMTKDDRQTLEDLTERIAELRGYL